MSKCWIHGEIVTEKPTKPLKEHPGFPDTIKGNFKQNIELILEPSQETYRTKEERLAVKEKGLEEDFQQKNLKREKEKAEFKKKKQEEVDKIENKLNQLITRIMSISEKPTGELFDPALIKQKGIKELLERYSVNTLEELVKFIDKVSSNYQELLSKIELLNTEVERERERERERELSKENLKKWCLKHKELTESEDFEQFFGIFFTKEGMLRENYIKIKKLSSEKQVIEEWKREMDKQD